MRIQTRAGHAAYRDQLDRARRFLDRMERPVDSMDDDGMTDVDFQDMVWAFFQNCWHVKDWLDNDESVSRATRSHIVKLARASVTLKVCEQLCNGTKHTSVKSERSGEPKRRLQVTITSIPPSFPAALRLWTA
jgi:hypothetical protein